MNAFTFSSFSNHSQMNHKITERKNQARTNRSRAATRQHVVFKFEKYCRSRCSLRPMMAATVANSSVRQDCKRKKWRLKIFWSDSLPLFYGATMHRKSTVNKVAAESQSTVDYGLRTRKENYSPETWGHTPFNGYILTSSFWEHRSVPLYCFQLNGWSSRLL
jgi:hypothetical protein